MPPKSPGEKWRYIAFKIDSGRQVARNDFLSEFLQASKGTPLHDMFRITVFDRNFGILKVRHTMKEDAIRTLSSLTAVRGVPCKVATLKTSGTIKTLKEKYKDLIGTGNDD